MEGIMRSTRFFILAGLALVGTALFLTLPAGRANPEKQRQATGIDKREAWTTSRVVGSPDPPPPYRLQKVFPDLKFNEALELAIIPGSDRWVVAERRGKIFTFSSDPKKAKKHLLLDVG